MRDDAPSSSTPALSNGQSQKRRRWFWPTLLVAAVLVTAGITYDITASMNANDHGCGFNMVYSGTQVCIQWVEISAGAGGTTVPSVTYGCPTLVTPGAPFVCWVNVTNPNDQGAQNLTNVSVGNIPETFALLSLSNPLPLTLGPGQVGVEKLTLRAPDRSGVFNLLFDVEVTAAP